MDKEFLLDWAKEYFRSRDAYEKKIIEIQQAGEDMKIKYLDHEDKIFGMYDLSESKNMAIEGRTSIITINNRKNLDFLYSEWDKLGSFQELRIYFINPFSTTDKKWIISPYIHSKICEAGALKIGLNAMFETVQPLTMEILKNKLAVQS